ncbi:hypothetical protein EB796_022860 [Bugula neritina]|nr:hypothetical protein EB796_022860 [Bugula neritina]
MKFLEERLENGEEWLVGKQMTIADIVVASFMDSQVWPKPLADLKASKTVSNLTSKVTSLPKIKQWIATRPVTDY